MKKKKENDRNTNNFVVLDLYGESGEHDSREFP